MSAKCPGCQRLLAVIGVILTSAGAFADRAFYVSTAGSDTWTGRLPAPNARRSDGPFATIARAREAIRQAKASPGGLAEPVTVQIRGGTYTLAETITLTPEDSGTKQCPISYIAYPGETPVLCGGRKVTGWRPYRGKIQCAALPEVKAGTWNFRSLYVNGERQIRARYPNVDPTDPCRKGFLYIRRGQERRTVGGMHNQGDTLDYEVRVPAPGEYAVWLRYAHNMKALGTADMGGRTSLALDGGQPTPLKNLPDTGGWGTYQWGRAATVSLVAGQHSLRWRNDQGGGYGLDAIILSDDPSWAPVGGDWPPAAAGKHLVAIEAEDFVRADAPQFGFGATDVDALPKGQKTSFPYGPGDVKPSWAHVPDAEVHVFPADSACRGYKQITHLVQVDEPARSVTIGGAECVTDLGVGDRYFVENVLGELDSPGEWYLDRQASLLYYWPKREPLGKSEVIAPVLGRLIQFEGDEAKGQVLSNVRWVGLTFTDTDYSPDDGCVGYSTGNNGVIYLRGAVQCAVRDCHFVNNGKAAVFLEGGRENTISGNDIWASAEGGVNLKDSAADTITDNHIHHLGAVYKHVGGIVLNGQGSRNNVVAHNLIHDTTRWAIALGAVGTGNVIEYNEVYNTSLETYDTGGIMAYQDDKQFNCDSIIRYNLVHDGVGYSSLLGNPMFDSRGIYIDGFSSGWTIAHNLVYRNSSSGIFVQGGHDVRVINNVAVGNGGPQYLHTNFMENGANLEFARNILCSPTARIALMWIYNGGEKLTQFDHNLYFHSAGDICYPVANTFAAWQALGYDAHSLQGDPLFVNPRADDYSLKPESPALKLGFERIDTSQIGLVHKRCNCHSPLVAWGPSK